MAGTDGLRFEQRSAAVVQAVPGLRELGRGGELPGRGNSKWKAPGVTVQSQCRERCQIQREWPDRSRPGGRFPQSNRPPWSIPTRGREWIPWATEERGWLGSRGALERARQSHWR